MLNSEKESGFKKKPINPFLLNFSHKNGHKFIKRLINQQKWKDKEKQGTDSLACKDSLRWGDAQKDTRVKNHWYFSMFQYFSSSI